jgi:hypothetical protein
MIPSNAQPIIDARTKGFKPVELILVSLIGRLNEPNHTVYADAAKRYDWRWVRGLQLCIFAEPGTGWIQTAKDIAEHRPFYLSLWDANRKEGAQLWLFPKVEDIAKPPQQWRHALDYLPWLDCQNKDFESCN